jgi:acyl dehydratase
MAMKSKESAVFTDAVLAEARSFIGKPLRIEQYNHEVTYDAIRHYAFGLGDDNPLWCDEEYASAGRFGGMVGSPTFYLSVFPPTVSPGLRGFSGFHAGGDYSWTRLPRRGEWIVAGAKVTDVSLHAGRASGEMLIQHSETTYRTREGELLATFAARSFRLPKPGGAREAPYEEKPPYAYSQDELQQIADDVFAESRRGGEVRYWEDVAVGDGLGQVVKGPLDRLTMLCYYAGAMPGIAYRAAELAWKQRLLGQTSPELLPENYNFARHLFDFGNEGLGHHDRAAARAVGMPGQYDNGHMRIGWVSHLMTNWMGDHGDLASLHTEIRRPNVMGNTTRISGTVVEKRVGTDGRGEVVVDARGVDQTGVVNTTARAVIVLPLRDQVHSRTGREPR